MRKAAKRLLFASALLAGLVAIAFWLVGNRLTAPTNSVVEIADPEAIDVAIASGDNIELAGSYWPSAGNGNAVLLLHGNGSNRGGMVHLAGYLNARGFAVLAIDLRGHGESTPASKSFGYFESEDATSAVSWLRQETDGAQVGVIGFSLGGAASLLGPDGPLPVDAMVLIGVFPDIRTAIHNRLAIRIGHFPAAMIEPILSYQSYPRLGVSPAEIAPIEAIANVAVPVMVVGGGADLNTPPAETEALFEAYEGRGELMLLDGVGHNELGGRNMRDIQPAIADFLSRSLAPDL